MIIAPFAHNDVFTTIPDNVIHLIIIMTQVLDENFFARAFRSVYTHKHDVVSYKKYQID